MVTTHVFAAFHDRSRLRFGFSRTSAPGKPHSRSFRRAAHPAARLVAVTLGVALAQLAASCSPPPASPAAAALDLSSFHGAQALEEAAALVAISPRDAGTKGAARAAAHLEQRLRALGLAVQVDSFQDDTPDGPLPLRNVVATIPGSGPARVLLLSHFDTKSGIPGFTGANDSASSSGLLLALAGFLAPRAPLRATVLVAFVDGEECLRAYSDTDGLRGSRRLAARLAAEPGGTAGLSVILLDMIGDRDLSVTIPRNGTPSLMAHAFAAAAAEGARDQFSLYPGDILDDHVPFMARGIPAIDLIDFAYGSAPGQNDYWHTAQDDLDKLSADSLQTVGRVVLRMIDALASEQKDAP